MTSKHPSIATVFQDLTSRFFVNLPDEELETFERLFFQLEQAHWFYTDFYSDEFAHLPKLTLKNFCKLFFERSSLKPHLHRFEDLFTRFRDYLGQVPVSGCILLNPMLTKCVLVRSWQGKSWGFPKGKINENESDFDCAAREVLEEVGFDVGSRLVKTAFIEARLNRKKVRLYILVNVDEQTTFATQTRKEIGAIEWFSILDLVSSNSDKQCWNVRPFLAPLQSWIRKYRRTGHKSNSRPASPADACPPSHRTASAPLPRQRYRAQRSHSQLKHLTPPKSAQGERKLSHSAGPSLAYDRSNETTFGSASSSWTPEQMFSTNEKLFGVKSTVPSSDIQYTAEAERLAQQILKSHKHRSQFPIVLPTPVTVPSAKAPPSLPQQPITNQFQPPVKQLQPPLKQFQPPGGAPTSQAISPSSLQPLKQFHPPGGAPTSPVSMLDNPFLEFRFDTGPIMAALNSVVVK